MIARYPYGPLYTRDLYTALGEAHRRAQDEGMRWGRHGTDAYLVAHQQLRHRVAAGLDPRLDRLPFHAQRAAIRVQLDRSLWCGS